MPTPTRDQIADILAEVEAAEAAALATEHWIIAPGTIDHRPFSQAVANLTDAAGVADTIAAIEGRICEVHTIISGKLTNVTRHHPSGARERRAIFRSGGLIAGVIL